MTGIVGALLQFEDELSRLLGGCEMSAHETISKRMAHLHLRFFAVSNIEPRWCS